MSWIGLIVLVVVIVIFYQYVPAPIWLKQLIGIILGIVVLVWALELLGVVGSGLHIR